MAALGTCLCASACLRRRPPLRPDPPAPLQRAEDFLRRAAAASAGGRPPASGAFDFLSVCPPYELVDYSELYDLLDDSPLLHEVGRKDRKRGQTVVNLGRQRGIWSVREPCGGVPLYLLPGYLSPLPKTNPARSRW